MQTHRNVFGDRPISELCIPHSHDAGASRLGYSTSFGTESNVLTQTRSIFDQLELGTRRLDIRPYLTSPGPGKEPGDWACGHFTGEAQDTIGWQGANCLEIQEVVDDMNRFTQDNAELIIVDITHTSCIFIKNPISSTRRDPNSDEWKSLLKVLTGIRNLFTIDRAGGDKQKPLQDYLLNQLIGNGQAAVVVIVKAYDDRNYVFGCGFWPKEMSDNTEYLCLKKTYVTRTQSTFDAISSTLSLGQIIGPDYNSDSVLSLARKAQDEQFPWLLQKLAGEGYAAGIAMDRIENADLLTFCLATSYQRYNQSKQIPSMVVVYGGYLITSPQAHNAIKAAIDNGESFTVTNESLGSDPWFGMTKSCAVFYEQDSIVKGRFAREGQALHFEQDVISINYGKQIRDQALSFCLLKTIRDRIFFHRRREPRR